MKKASLVLSLVALGALTGCSLFGGTKVSVEKFQEAVDKIEEHTYTKATVSYKIDMKGTGLYEDSTEKASGKIEYTYDADSKTWKTDSSDKHADDYKYDLYSIRGMKFTNSGNQEDENLKTTTTYYTNPLKVTQTIKGETTVLGVTTKVDGTYTYTFDKYGFVTKCTTKSNTSTEGGSSGISVSGTSKGTESFTVSYK